MDRQALNARVAYLEEVHGARIAVKDDRIAELEAQLADARAQLMNDHIGTFIAGLVVGGIALSLVAKVFGGAS